MSEVILQVLAELEQEHGEVREALSALGGFAKGGDEERLRSALPGWAGILCAGLDEHSRKEDTVAFPPVAEAVGSGIIATFVSEHVEILAARDRLYAAHGDADLLTECLDLASLLESHMDREESILFPSIRNVLEAGD